MTLVESHERLVKINGRYYWVYIDEYKTIWSLYCNVRVMHFVVRLIGDTRNLSSKT